MITEQKINRLFLIDGVGALTTALILGVIMPLFQRDIGLKTSSLYILAFIATSMATFSIFHHATKTDHAKGRLRIMAIANILYCVLSAFVVMIQRADITPFGVVYFSLEIIVILSLALYELRTVQLD